MTSRPPISGDQPPRERRYRNASELGSFRFCERAWMFEQQGAPSEREPERMTGTAYHQQHGEQVSQAWRVRGIGRWFLLLGILLLLLGLWMSMR
jgi:hypothetical protein